MLRLEVLTLKKLYRVTLQCYFQDFYKLFLFKIKPWKLSFQQAYVSLDVD